MPAGKFYKVPRGKKKETTKDAINSLKKSVRNIQSGIETQVHDTNVTAPTSIPQAGLMVHLSDIDGGSTLVTRQGRQLALKGLNARIRVRYPVGVTSAFDKTVRVVIFFDKTPNQQAPTLADLYSVTDPVLAQRTWNEKFRYQIIYEKTMVLRGRAQMTPSTDIVYSMGESRILDIRKGLKNKKVEWTSDTVGDNTTMSRNALYLLIVGDSSSDQCTYEMATRITYIDF